MTKLRRGQLWTFARLALVGTIVLTAAACARIEMPAHLKPLSRDTMMQLGARKMQSDAPIFIRIFKAESELEVWKKRKDGRFHHFKTYPICTWSGALGPKMKQGDKQAPEGFYKVNRHLMNPNSKFHLAFNLGYPNAFDRANKRTGDFLMVHGDCTSAGCYAMTDPLIEEIYALAREAFIGGQSAFWVHAFPFRMTPENMARHAKSTHMPFWTTLKQGYDHFEATRVPPPIAVCERKYVVNAIAPKGRKLRPNGRCPRTFERPEVTPFVVNDPPTDSDRLVVDGVKRRQAMLSLSTATRSGLTKPGTMFTPWPRLSFGSDKAPSKTLEAGALFDSMRR
ncbi:MAG: murein L,D-transpeptidase family protein [Pseudomonadota bacterium]